MRLASRQCLGHGCLWLRAVTLLVGTRGHPSPREASAATDRVSSAMWLISGPQRLCVSNCPPPPPPQLAKKLQLYKKPFSQLFC